MPHLIRSAVCKISMFVWRPFKEDKFKQVGTYNIYLSKVDFFYKGHKLMFDSSNVSFLTPLNLFFRCDKNINVQFFSLKWSFYYQTMLVYAHSMFAFKLYTYVCPVKKLFSLIDKMSIINTICLYGIFTYTVHFYSIFTFGKY